MTPRLRSNVHWIRKHYPEFFHFELHKRCKHHETHCRTLYPAVFSSLNIQAFFSKSATCSWMWIWAKDKKAKWQKRKRTIRIWIYCSKNISCAQNNTHIQELTTHLVAQHRSSKRKCENDLIRSKTKLDFAPIRVPQLGKLGQSARGSCENSTKFSVSPQGLFWIRSKYGSPRGEKKAHKSYHPLSSARTSVSKSRLITPLQVSWVDHSRCLIQYPDCTQVIDLS